MNINYNLGNKTGFFIYFVIVLTFLLECKNGKAEKQREHGQPMAQKRGLFGTCPQSQRQCHVWRMSLMFEMLCTGK